MKEIWIFDKLPAKFCGMVEEYRLELAKRSPLELDLDVSLAWITICWIHETVLISKKFWFIKWLVENDKIYLDNEDLVSLMSDLRERRHPVKCLLMLLSIQDNPIEFLISILK